MDPLFVSLPQTVERVTKNFLESPERSEAEKISIATLAALAQLAKDVFVPSRQDLMIGTSIEAFYRQAHQEISQRANGQMVNLAKSFSILSGASYGKKDFHELVSVLLREQIKFTEANKAEANKKEGLNNVAYGVIKNLVRLVLETKTEKDVKQVKELLIRLLPDDDYWQEML